MPVAPGQTVPRHMLLPSLAICSIYLVPILFIAADVAFGVPHYENVMGIYLVAWATTALCCSRWGRFLDLVHTEKRGILKSRLTLFSCVAFVFGLQSILL